MTLPNIYGTRTGAPIPPFGIRNRRAGIHYRFRMGGGGYHLAPEARRKRKDIGAMQFLKDYAHDLFEVWRGDLRNHKKPKPKFVTSIGKPTDKYAVLAIEFERDIHIVLKLERDQITVIACENCWIEDHTTPRPLPKPGNDKRKTPG